MRAVVFSFTYKGSRLSSRVAKALSTANYKVVQYAMPKYCDVLEQQPLIPDLGTLSRQVFASSELLVYIGATGIAVRAIAPLVKDKTTDPAVVCIDELGRFTIPLLSGHIGGANRLAQYLANSIDSTAVVTTATDINHLPAIDEWATANGLYITDMLMAKRIAAGLLDGECIGMINLTDNSYECPQGFVPNGNATMGVVVADDTEVTPYAQTLFLLPQNIHLGIGCRRGADMADIESLVMAKLSELGIDIGRVANIASIDLKADEKGLLAFADKYNIDTRFYSAEQLLTVTGEFSASEFVRSVTGVDNVCERAAILSSGGRLLLHKSSGNGVTVAVGVR